MSTSKTTEKSDAGQNSAIDPRTAACGAHGVETDAEALEYLAQDMPLTYDYATDAESGEVEAHSLREAYAICRAWITPAMIADGATLWVEGDEGRFTLGINAD